MADGADGAAGGAGIAAVLWDFGGVITSSPFDAFLVYEQELGLPGGFIRNLNATNAEANAWAQLERSEIDTERFVELFEGEAQRAGGMLSGRRVLELLEGAVRPEMVAALDRCVAAGLRTACLTNNVVRPAGSEAGEGPAGSEAGEGRVGGRRADLAAVMARFDVVVESSVAGVRKPDTRFYEIACEQLGVEPTACVFLDDLGVNLKPARAMGMTTIKVESAAQAIAALEAVLGIALR